MFHTALSNERGSPCATRHCVIPDGKRLPTEMFCNVSVMLMVWNTWLTSVFRDPDQRPTAAELRKHPYLELQPDWTFNGFKWNVYYGPLLMKSWFFFPHVWDNTFFSDLGYPYRTFVMLHTIVSFFIYSTRREFYRTSLSHPIIHLHSPSFDISPTLLHCSTLMHLTRYYIVAWPS